MRNQAPSRRPGEASAVVDGGSAEREHVLGDRAGPQHRFGTRADRGSHSSTAGDCTTTHFLSARPGPTNPLGQNNFRYIGLVARKQDFGADGGWPIAAKRMTASHPASTDLGACCERQVWGITRHCPRPKGTAASGRIRSFAARRAKAEVAPKANLPTARESDPSGIRLYATGLTDRSCSAREMPPEVPFRKSARFLLPLGMETQSTA
jgi:hypothetical protein